MKVIFLKYPLFIFIGILVFSSCKRDKENEDVDQLILVDGADKTDSIKGNGLPDKGIVKIYFENTLSMDGYINGNTSFKDVFRELLVAVDNENKINLETEFYLINNELTPTNFGVKNTKISEELTPQSTAGKGNKNSSNFEEILNTILQKQDKNVISIIMADFIYSPKGESNTISALNKLRTYTKDAFLRAIEQNKTLETKIFSFKSDFKGVYYDINNKSIQGINSRPYYYFIIAPTGLMTVFTNEIAPQLKKTKGYRNEAFFTTSDYNPISTEILSSTANKGRLRVRDENLEIVSYPKEENLKFIGLIDFSDIPVDNKYLTDKGNYSLSNLEFSIKEVGLKKGKNVHFEGQIVEKINANDLVSIINKKFTHAIHFEAEGMVSEDLKFALRKKIPAWVQKSHSDDDRQIYNDRLEQSKTFGLSYLIEGVLGAYLQIGNDEYFNVTISVK
jgi:hypothetical protein